MTLPKIKKFTDYNHYPDDPQPTTDADMQNYMLNQNDILAALTKRLWQPQTEYKLGDIVASDAMTDGLVAVCTIAGVTSDIEPEWGVNEATVIDNSCTWIMRPAYCYGLATEGDVQTVHDGGSAENSRLLSVGVLDKIFALIKDKFIDLFGENDVLPITHGGTGQATAAAARNALGLGNTTGALPVANGGTGVTSIANIITALFGTSALGSLSKPVYYNGSKFVECAASVGAANNGGIIAASLNTNGYVKFANGLILQWGTIASTTRETSVTFAISFTTVYSAVATVYASAALERDQQCATIYSVSTTGMKLGLYDNDQTGWYWVAIGK